MITLNKNHPRYPKYKPSDIDWIGDVPDGWEVKKLKFSLIRNDGGVWGEDPIDDLSGTVVLRSTEQKVDGTLFIENPARRILSTTEIEKALLKEGDLLITKSSGSSNHIGKTSFIDTETAVLNCCFSNFMQRLRMKQNCSSKYIAYALNNQKIGREQLDYLSQTTTGLANLNGTLLGEIIFPSPPLKVQQSITVYLDEKTALLDESIAKKKQQIDLLSEHRTALINNAITKGLDFNVEMKDSGIDWIGTIPKGWKVKKLKYTASNKNHKTPFSSDLFSVALENVESWTGKYLPAEGEKIFETDMNTFDKGDVLFGKLRPYLAKAYKATCSGLCVGEFLVLRPSGEITQDFLFFRTISSDFITQVNNSTFGSKMPRADWGFIGNLIMGIPPIAEQKEIVDYLEKETAYIDSMKSKIEQSIELLQEYKTSLISNVVRGKIKVS